MGFLHLDVTCYILKDKHGREVHMGDFFFILLHVEGLRLGILHCLSYVHSFGAHLIGIIVFFFDSMFRIVKSI